MATSRRYPIGCALGLILGGIAGQALAEPPAASNDNGLMTFPNVSVVNAPIAAAEQQPATASPGVKAYIDPASGELTSTPSAEQARQLSNAAAARTRTAIAKNGAAATSAQQADDRITYHPDNSVEIQLDDEFMVFQVAHKDADGKLTQECVTGEDTATHALHSTPTKDVAQQEESHNDR